MYRQNLVRLAIFSLLLAFGSSVTMAGMVNTYVVADGTEDELTDTSRAILDDFDSNGLSVGDVIYGWVAISGVSPDPNGYGAQAKRIVVVFSAKVTAVSGSTWSLDYNDTGSHDLTDLLPAALHPKAGRAGTLGADEIAVVISGPNPVSPLLSASDFASGTGFPASDYSYEATLGLVSSADFFAVDFSVAPAPTERGGFTVMDASGSYGNSPGIVYIPVSVTDFGGTVHQVEISLEGSIFAGSGGYTYSDQSNFRVNATPEPASLALWSCICAGLGIARVRRRRRAVA